MKSKELIRQEIRTRLDEQSPAEREKESRIIQKKLFDSDFFKDALHIMLYASLDTEVETSSMIDEAIAAGKKVSIPYIKLKGRELQPIEITNRKRDCEQGPFGIAQPKDRLEKYVNPNSLDVIIVPGLAFTLQGQRLGRGAGYYDRFLRRTSAAALSVGLAFRFQIMDSLPIRDHDMPVDIVLTA